MIEKQNSNKTQNFIKIECQSNKKLSIQLLNFELEKVKININFKLIAS